MCWDPTVIFLHLAPTRRVDGWVQKALLWVRKRDTENCLTNNNFRDRPVSKVIIKNKPHFHVPVLSRTMMMMMMTSHLQINLNVKHATRMIWSFYLHTFRYDMWSRLYDTFQAVVEKHRVNWWLSLLSMSIKSAMNMADVCHHLNISDEEMKN